MTQSHGRLHEHSFNIEFGKALANTDARWRSHANKYILTERTGVLDRGRADVLITDPKMPVVAVETSFNSADADKDARSRLGSKTIEDGREVMSALAVHIPEEFRELSSDTVADNLENKVHCIGYALYQKNVYNETLRRWPQQGFILGTLHDMGRLISAASMPEEVVKSHAENVAKLVKQAASLLQANLHPSAQLEVVEVVGQHSPLEGLRTTMVLCLNALLTQQRLRDQGVEGIPPLQGISGSRPMPSLQIKVWKRILDVNWRSIFEPAVRALGTCGDRHAQVTADSLIRLIKAVEVIENADLGRHINVGAELFPKLASDRKESAAFYTQPATAELLACLTIQRSDKEKSHWADSDLLRQSVIADLACGTGTLLRAGYLRIQDLHKWAGGGGDGRVPIETASWSDGVWAAGY